MEYFISQGQATVAYHHSGLSTEERECIEILFKKGHVKVIFCTSTLAAGVNLPAKRVIIASIKQGYNSELSSIQYTQMIGRAGRYGFDLSADSILCCWPNERLRAVELTTRKLERVESCLGLSQRGLSRTILEGVGIGLVKDQF
jgi:DNA polymerase theta